METYLVFGGNGFWGKNSQWVSEVKDAKLFTLDQAVEFCKKRYNSRVEGPLPALPVLEADALRVSSK